MNETLQKSDKVVSPSGCSLFVVTEVGEVLASFPVPAGVIKVAQYWDLLEPGLHLETDGAVFSPPSAFHRSDNGLLLESGANPDFQPTMMTDLERQARAMMHRMQQQSDLLEARQQAFEREVSQRVVMPMALAQTEAPAGGEVVE